MKARLLLHRFRPIRALHRDAGLHWIWAEDRLSRKPVWVQWIGGPGLAEDVNLARQQEALQALWEAEDDSASEWKFEGDEAILVAPAPGGRAWLDLSETQRDEFYLERLRQGLERLRTLHEAGFVALSQHRDSWRLVPEESDGERLVFCDLSLFPAVPCGATLPTSALLSLPPELFAEAPLDGRADLYALASIFLRQRHPKAFEKLGSFAAWLDFHLGGRMVELVPKTPTSLNETLRRMLQPDPGGRPAGPKAALAELAGKTAAEEEASLADWGVERLRRRRATLVFGSIQRLLGEGNPRGGELLETCPLVLRETDAAAWHFLKVLAARESADASVFFARVSEAETALAARREPRLEILLDLEVARRKTGESEAAEALADRALTVARTISEEELLAKALGEKAKSLMRRAVEAEALPLLREAWPLSALGEDAALRESLGLDLMQGLAAAGQTQAALDVLEALRVSGEGVRPELLELSAALLKGRLGLSEAAKEEFYRAKSRFSARKDIAGLVWACAQELRFLIESGERETVLREYRLLKNRSRGMEGLRPFLDLLELKMALVGVPGAIPPEHAEAGLEAVLSGSEVFREWLWSSAESWELWADYAQQLGRPRDNENLENRAETWRETLRKSLASFALPEEAPGASPPSEPALLADEPSAQEAPSVSPPALYSPDEQEVLRLREENKVLRERVRRLEAKLSEQRRSRIGEAEEILGEVPPAPELAALRETAERRSIAAALRRHLGNRIKAAAELQIHRRTLFEKIRRYRLSEADYMPSLEEVEKTLAECRGRKGLAAEKLGMSRSTFYRWLKSFGAPTESPQPNSKP